MAFPPEMSLYYQLLIPKLITWFVWYTGETINNCIWRRSVWGSHYDSAIHEVSCLLVHPRAHFTVIRSPNFIRCKTNEIGPHSVNLKQKSLFASDYLTQVLPAFLAPAVYANASSVRWQLWFVDILVWRLYFHSSFRYLLCSARCWFSQRAQSLDSKQ